MQPLVIGVLARDAGLHLLILDDAAFLEVDQKHLAWLQAPLADDLLVGDRQHAGFRRQYDMIVVGHDEARRAQAVAVQRRADLAAVGEGDRRRTVPRLHQGCVVFVEGASRRVHVLMSCPCFGDEHHHGVAERIAACHEQLERVVEAGRVRLAVRDQRPHLVEVGAEKRALHRAAAGVHPVHVAAHRVDLAVVGDEAVGVRQLPAREGVGGEALVDQRQRALAQWVGEVLVEGADLACEQQSLVDDGARR